MPSPQGDASHWYVSWLQPHVRSFSSKRSESRAGKLPTDGRPDFPTPIEGTIDEDVNSTKERQTDHTHKCEVTNDGADVSTGSLAFAQKMLNSAKQSPTTVAFRDEARLTKCQTQQVDRVLQGLMLVRRKPTLMDGTSDLRCTRDSPRPK